MSRNLALKSARAARDMTQKDLAEAVGVSRQTINAIEAAGAFYVLPERRKQEAAGGRKREGNLGKEG